MKKLFALLLCLMLALTCTALADTDDYIGTWFMQEMIFEGTSMNVADLGMICELTLDEDGTFTLDLMGDTAVTTWQEENGAAYMIDPDSGEQIPMTIEDGILTFYIGSEGMTFTRDVPTAAGYGEEPAVEEDVYIEAFIGVWQLDHVVSDGFTSTAEELWLDETITIYGDTYFVTSDGESTEIMNCTLEGYELQLPDFDATATFRTDASLVITTSDGDFWYTFVDMPGDAGYDYDYSYDSEIPLSSLPYTVPTFTGDLDTMFEYVGVWYMTRIGTEGQWEYPLEYGLIWPLYMNADGTAALVADGETQFVHWGDDRGYFYIPDPYGFGDDYTLTLEMKDGEPELGLIVYAEDGSIDLGMYFTSVEPEGAEFLDYPEFPVYIDDLWIYEYDEDDEDAFVPEIPAIISDVTADDFAGTWELELFIDWSGIVMAEDIEVAMTIEINADGSYTFDMDGDVMNGLFWLDGSELVFAEFEGKAVLCEDGCLYVLEDEDALKFNCTAKPAASDGTAAEEPAAGSSNGSITETRYVVTACVASGVSLDPAMLGGEYSVVFHEGGTADLVIAGAAMPGATWTLDDSGAVLVDYYGMAFSFVPADNGFTMDYYGTMLLTYTAE